MLLFAGCYWVRLIIIVLLLFFFYLLSVKNAVTWLKYNQYNNHKNQHQFLFEFFNKNTFFICSRKIIPE